MALKLIVSKGLEVQSDNLAVQPKDGWIARRQMQVGGPLFLHHPEKRVYFSHAENLMIFL
jgi:hypothetical protein